MCSLSYLLLSGRIGRLCAACGGGNVKVRGERGENAGKTRRGRHDAIWPVRIRLAAATTDVQGARSSPHAEGLRPACDVARRGAARDAETRAPRAPLAERCGV